MRQYQLKFPPYSPQIKYKNLSKSNIHCSTIIYILAVIYSARHVVVGLNYTGASLYILIIILKRIEYKYKYNTKTMQQETFEWPITSLLHRIINSNHVNITSSIVSFLGPEEISIIADFALQHQKAQFFYQIAIAHHFLNQFINKVDRTNFYLFYDDPQFKQIEQQNVLSIVTTNYYALVKHYQSFTQLVSALRSQIGQLQGHEELNSIISSIFFETDLSLPKMKRQTIGMYCESAFQEYLSLLKFPEDDLEEPWIEQCIVQLKQQTDKELQLLISHFPYYQSPIQHPASTTHEKIRLVRFSGFKVTHANWREFLIQGFRMHNIIVVMFALCSQLVASYTFMLEHIEDPFLRFADFSLRASVYRNLILNLDEKFGFLFSSYSHFYENVYSPPLDRPAFKFWQPALSIWIQNMKEFHLGNQKIYNYVTSKMREVSLLEFLQQKTDKLPSFFSNLKDQVEMHLFSESRKAQAYSENDSKVQLEYFFENNQELYEILVKDYLQYMVDVSINQFSVHSCGHSRHSINQHPLFQPFQESLTIQTSKFYSFIKETLFSSCPQELRLGFYRETIKEDLVFANLKIAKPVILRSIIDMANQSILSEVEKMPEFAIFEEQGIAKYRLNWDFQEKDALLDYFCGKYHIGECPQKLQYYYNCQLDDNSEEKDSDCEQSFEYCEQYNSDEQMNEND